MKRRISLRTAALILSAAAALWAQGDSVPAGTQVTVRTNEAIKAKSPTDGRIYTGTVDRDVQDKNGNVVIPRGSTAELILRDSTADNVMVDLESIQVNGRRYTVSTPAQAVGKSSEKEGVGANKRTGKYVGGGAVLGTIIGAIAGGGKGAAIGAAAGAGAGAAGQTITRGKSVQVPAESLLTFRLDRSLVVGGPDTGVTREGRHYHTSTLSPDNPTR